MIVFESKPITTTYNSIPLENISAFNKNSAYIKGQFCIYLNKIYKALTDITPTVQFVWNSTDISNKFGYDLFNNILIPDPTHVYCTTSTIVWSIRNKKYYQAKVNGYVNFVTEDPITPADFNDLGANPTPLYRTELNYPDGKKNTLLWEYISGTNQNTMFDEVINKRAVNNRSFTTSGTTTFSNTGVITLATALPTNIYVNDKIKISGTTLNDGYYKISTIYTNRLTIILDRLTVSETISLPINIYTQTYIKWSDYGIDKIALFNTICDATELKVTTGGVTTTYNLSMVSTDFINTFELFCFNEPILKMKSTQTIIKSFNQDFELTFFGNTQEIGEVLQGSSYYLGKAEDSVSLNGKNYNPLVEADNGDVYLQDETKSINILDEKAIQIVYNSKLNSNIEDKLKSLMSKRLIVSGDSGDKEDLPFMLSYCFMRDYNISPIINDDLNKFTLTIREFL